MQRSIVCEACKVFKPNHQCMSKHKARVLDIVLIVKTFWGGSWRVWGGSFPPPHPPVDETLLLHMYSLNTGHAAFNAADCIVLMPYCSLTAIY